MGDAGLGSFVVPVKLLIRAVAGERAPEREHSLL